MSTVYSHYCRQECGRLASELAERHQADSRRALEELTRLRDSQLTQAQGAWQLEQSRMAALVSTHKFTIYGRKPFIVRRFDQI